MTYNSYNKIHNKNCIKEYRGTCYCLQNEALKQFTQTFCYNKTVLNDYKHNNIRSKYYVLTCMLLCNLMLVYTTLLYLKDTSLTTIKYL